MDLPNTTPLIKLLFLLAGAMSQNIDNDPGDLIVDTPNSSPTSRALQPDTDDELFEPQPRLADGGPNCKCIDYHLRNPDSTIITNGEGVLLPPG
jgi:hypothetical protein